jgi:hypothetical protein
MSTSSISINVSAQKATTSALLTALVKGIETELAHVDPIAIDGSALPRTELLDRFQGALNAIAAVKTARTALSQAVASQKAATAQAMTLRSGVKRFLQTKYGPKSPKLQDFGFTPVRVAKTAVKTKAQAKVKAQATRIARGTRGRKQKALIKGDATTVTAISGAVAKSPETAKPAGDPVMSK